MRRGDYIPERPLLLKLLLRERHWQNYGTFCAEYDKAATRIEPDLAGSVPSRAQLHRWLTGSLRGLPYPDHCRVLEEMLPGWTAEQLFQPASPDLLHLTGPIPSPRAEPGMAGPPVFAAPSVGMRPFIEQAFTAEHVTIDFAGFSGETLHGAIQEPLDNIRIGRIKPATVAIRMLLPDTSRPMVLPCRAEDLTDDPEHRARTHRLTTISLIGRLAAHYDDSMIAKVLNQQQRRTATGMSFTPANVATVRRRNAIPAHQGGTGHDEDGEAMSVHQAAAELGITASTLYRWLNDGYVAGEQITPGAPWRIRLTDSIRVLVADDAPAGWVPMQVATATLGVSRQTVLQRVKRGDLRAVHIRAGRRKGLRIELPDPQDCLF